MGPSPTRSLSTAESRHPSKFLHCTMQKRRRWSHLMPAVLDVVQMQKQPSGKMRTVAYPSRSMTEIERRYAQIDKEPLAII